MSLIPKTRLMKHSKTLSLAMCVASLMLPAKAADNEWWFDVEIILFERDLTTTEVSESFKQSSLLPGASHHDLITPYLTPDLSYLRASLDYCRTSRRLLEQQKYQQGFALPTVQEIIDYQPVITDDNINATDELFNELTEQNAEQTLNKVEDIEGKPDGLSNQVMKKNSLSNQPVENFEYAVATDDVFSDDGSPTHNTADKNRTAPESLSNKTNLSEEVQEQANIDVPSPSLPIVIDWLEWQIPDSLPCAYAEQVDPILNLDEQATEDDPLLAFESTPIALNGVEWQDKRGPFLLPQDTMRMQDLFTSIKKEKGVRPILHSAWRQQVTFGAEKAQTFRLFAGKNYALEFNAQGALKPQQVKQLTPSLDIAPTYLPEEERAKMSEQEYLAWLNQIQNKDADLADENNQLMAKIDQLLEAPLPIDGIVPENQLLTQQPELNTTEDISQLWQIDGHIKVYLKNVGRVPYLHIDSNLDYRLPVASQTNVSSSTAAIDTMPSVYLQSANFNQLRRVISKQVHYFDHPLFGMVVRLHRYKWPVPPTEPATDTPEG